MSQVSDDLTPRPAPSPSENKTAVIVPSVPDVSIVFDPVNSNTIQPQSFMTTNFSRPIFIRTHTKFDPIIEQDHHPPVKSPPPVIFGHKVEYKQQYLNHQHLHQHSDLKQQHYVQQTTYTPSPPPLPPPLSQHPCGCHNPKLSPTPHIISVQTNSEIIPETPQNTPQSSASIDYPELKQIIDILQQNQSELRQINDSNERNRKVSENLLLEVQDYKQMITTIVNKQNTIESKIYEIEVKMNQNFNEIKTMIDTKLNNFMNNNNFESGNVHILPKLPNNGKLIFSNRAGDDNPSKLILSNCKNSPIFAQHKQKPTERNTSIGDTGRQANGECDMKELFNKYEIKGTLNRRSIDYSVSSMNYLQRYGLLDDHK